MATPPNPTAAAGPQPSHIQTQPPFVAFQAGNVPPSQAIYLQLNDAILIRTLSNITPAGIVANYRYLTPTGEIKEGLKPLPVSTVVQSTSFPIGEGWLLSIVLNATAGMSIGSWVHAQIGIVRGSLTAIPINCEGLIWEGYVNNAGLNGWPGIPSKDAWDGPGTPRQIVGTQPLAGSDVSEVVPSNRRWQLLSFKAALTTSATVANRIPIFRIDDGVNINYQAGPSVALAASLTETYGFSPGLQNYNDNAGNFIIPAPTATILKAGYRISTATTAIQVGDQWGFPIYDVLEWASYDT